MKARVKATGKIVEVELANTYRFNDGGFVEVFRDLNADTLYFGCDLDFDVKEKSFPKDEDYWTRFEHQAAIAAMQGMLAGTYYQGLSHDRVVEDAQYIAHALVEKYKKEEK